MSKEKFVRTKEHNISNIKITSDGMNVERLKHIQGTAIRKGRELGLTEANFSRYNDLNVAKEY